MCPQIGAFGFGSENDELSLRVSHCTGPLLVKAFESRFRKSSRARFASRVLSAASRFFSSLLYTTCRRCSDACLLCHISFHVACCACAICSTTYLSVPRMRRYFFKPSCRTSILHLFAFDIRPSKLRVATHDGGA